MVERLLTLQPVRVPTALGVEVVAGNGRVDRQPLGVRSSSRLRHIVGIELAGGAVGQ
jgi:hypothetical protein